MTILRRGFVSQVEYNSAPWVNYYVIPAHAGIQLMHSINLLTYLLHRFFVPKNWIPPELHPKNSYEFFGARNGGMTILRQGYVSQAKRLCCVILNGALAE